MHELWGQPLSDDANEMLLLHLRQPKTNIASGSEQMAETFIPNSAVQSQQAMSLSSDPFRRKIVYMHKHIYVTSPMSH